MAISVSFPFSWDTQPGAWRTSLSGCWFSLPHLISNSSDPQLLNREFRGPLLLVAVFSTASFLQLVWSSTDWISCALSYVIVQRPPSSCGHHTSHSRFYSDIPRPVAPAIYTGAFPILTARPGRRWIYNINRKQQYICVPNTSCNLYIEVFNDIHCISFKYLFVVTV